jgi:hypothetical protein
MPLFFYLPLIVWTGMVEVMADATTHDPVNETVEAIRPIR